MMGVGERCRKRRAEGGIAKRSQGQFVKNETKGKTGDLSFEDETGKCVEGIS